MKIDYTNLSFTQLIDKIESNRFFDIPRMVREAFTRLLTRVEALETPKYKAYTALLSQSGTSAPVATVLENTLGGDIVWSYDGVGEYTATSNGLFTEDKTSLSITPSQAVYYEFAKNENNQDELFLTQKLQTTDAGADDLLIKTSVEIRVYN